MPLHDRVETPPTGSSAATPQTRARDPLPVFFLAVVAVIGSVWIFFSDGFYPVDECAHYLYSRFVLVALPCTVETWHRPGLLWLFALPSQLGHTFTMFFCLAIFLVLLVVTFRIAALMNIRHAAWVVLLTGLQPVLFDISYACLAEMPAALVLALSYFFHLKGRHGWSLAIASAVFLFRFEMYLFAILMACVYIRQRQWRILPLVALGPVLWIGLSAIISGDVTTFFREWSKFSHLGKYVAGIPLAYYLEHLHTVFGIAQILLFASGVIAIFRAQRGGEFVIIFCAIAINIIINTLAGAEVVHWTGSVGEFRYIAVVAPFVGIVSAQGLSALFDRMRSPLGALAFSVLVFSVVVFNCTWTTHPRRWASYERIVMEMTETLRVNHPDLTLLSNNFVAAYAMDVPPSGGSHFEKLDAGMLAKYPRCLILWDTYSSNPRFFQTELTREGLLQDSTLIVLDRYRYWDSEYIFFLRDLRPAKTPG